MKALVSLIILIFSLVTTTLANGLQVDLTAFTQRVGGGGTATFNVRWYNSWRITTTPANWDAVWIFLKFRQCGASPTQEWTHALINTDLTTHTFPTALEPINANGTTSEIEAAPNNTGVLLRRTATNNVFPDAGWHTVTLDITNFDPQGTLIDVKIFGIEMVFIPEGAYVIGDNNVNNTPSINTFTTTTISSENQISLTCQAHTGGVNATANYQNIPATFPKGFGAFHIMKYEITQEQYAEFLNTISSVSAVTRYMGNYTNQRQMTADNGALPFIYNSIRGNRAQNYMRYQDFITYLDWAALRPMTELEYEKACRGAGGMNVNEYAWGTSAAINVTDISITVPRENGSEIAITPANANCRYNNIPMGNGAEATPNERVVGPVRAGLFALPTTSTRAASGASFYGVMELSGNVFEYVVPLTITGAPVYGGPWANFTRTSWGDGNITAGVSDQPNWYNGAQYFEVNNTTHFRLNFGYRGGGYASGAAELQVSYRLRCAHAGQPAGQPDSGGRGVR